jgi:hypothetical protein
MNQSLSDFCLRTSAILLFLFLGGMLGEGQVSAAPAAAPAPQIGGTVGVAKADAVDVRSGAEHGVSCRRGPCFWAELSR